jgi:hypothetical protein
MNFDNVYIAMQMMLQKDGHYKGEIDGKLGPKTYEAIKKLLKSYKITHTGWNNHKLKIAGEQALYKSVKIDVGSIDGIDDHVLGNARDVYQAKLTLNFRANIETLVKAEVIKPIPVKSTGKVTPLRSWPKQSACASYYGKVGTDQVTCVVPYQMVIAWEPKQKIQKFSCHRLVKPSLERIFQRTLDHYGYEKIKELRLHYFGGCLNVRKMRGGSSWSMHSWGIAVDLDPDNNQLRWGKDRATFAKPAYNKFWEFVYDEGAISLGKERNYDFMHFQFSRL